MPIVLSESAVRGRAAVAERSQIVSLPRRRPAASRPPAP